MRRLRQLMAAGSKAISQIHWEQLHKQVLKGIGRDITLDIPHATAVAVGRCNGKTPQDMVGLAGLSQTPSFLVWLELDCGHRPYSDPAGHFSSYAMRTE